MIIENRRFRAANLTAFADYVNGLTIPQSGTFHPQFVVLHNTDSPSLAQRLVGLTDQHIANLKAYYEGLGWAGGPHKKAAGDPLPLGRGGKPRPPSEGDLLQASSIDIMLTV